MKTSTVSVKLDSDVAAVFQKASPEDRRRLCALWALLLHEYKTAPTPLLALMDQIGTKAVARGLTSEELESILHAR